MNNRQLHKLYYLQPGLGAKQVEKPWFNPLKKLNKSSREKVRHLYNKSTHFVNREEEGGICCVVKIKNSHEPVS